MLTARTRPPRPAATRPSKARSPSGPFSRHAVERPPDQGGRFPRPSAGCYVKFRRPQQTGNIKEDIMATYGRSRTILFACLGAVFSLGGISSAAADYTDWYGGGVITNFLNCPTGNLKKFVI